jgi:hypothetical protein
MRSGDHEVHSVSQNPETCILSDMLVHRVRRIDPVPRIVGGIQFPGNHAAVVMQPVLRLAHHADSRHAGGEI